MSAKSFLKRQKKKLKKRFDYSVKGRVNRVIDNPPAIDPGSIVFTSSVDYSGNPKALFLYMIDHGYNEKYKMTWLFEHPENLPDGETAARMVEYANRELARLGYKPYYLYRQKYMSGSFENVGWSKENRDCLYNIYMMEEVHTILSLGGGGMNKVNLPDGTLQRFHNPKFPEQYIEQLDSVLRQKEELFQLMKGSV